jgi:hypothetical protein
MYNIKGEEPLIPPTLQNPPLSKSHKTLEPKNLTPLVSTSSDVLGRKFPLKRSRFIMLSLMGQVSRNVIV